jgi:NitT/TauT family transport system ATP-binding protein
MLRIAALSYAYGIKQVLDNISLQLEAGRTLALVGPSGCGKTTLLHECAGLLAVQSGTLENSFARPAMMFQQPRLLPWKTARDNITLGLKAAGVSPVERRRLAQAMGLAVGLDADALAQFPHQLSGGMQSRVALARALVLEPDLLLMDEPFSALDIGLKAQLHRLLLEQQAARRLAVLMITHDPMEAVRLADTVLIMTSAPGRIAHQIEIAKPPAQRDETFVHHTTAELLKTPIVRRCFGFEVPDSLSIVDAGMTAAARRIAC